MEQKNLFSKIFMPREVELEPVKRPQFYFTVFASLLTGLITLGISVTRVIAEGQFKRNILVTSFIALLLFANAFVPKIFNSVRKGAFLIVFAPLALVPANMFMPGTMISRLGIFSGAIPLFPSAVGASVLVLGARWGVFALAVSFLEIGILIHGHNNGTLPTPLGMAHADMWIHAFTALAPSCYAYAVSFVFVKTIQLWQELVEEQRQQAADAKRLGLLAKMAGGVAHEVNNPLSIIGALARKNLVMSKKQLLQHQHVEDATEKTIAQTARISDIVNSLLLLGNEFSSAQRVQFKSSELAADVAAISDKIKVISNFKIDAPLEAKREEVVYAIKALVQNALDATRGIENANVEIEFTVVDNKTKLKVRDNGKGVEKGKEEMIFEPFFSTKPIGEGKGLGLSVARSIAEGHGGSLELTVGSGTEFVMSLPVSKKAA